MGDGKTISVGNSANHDEICSNVANGKSDSPKICPDEARKGEYIVLSNTMMSANVSYLKFLSNLLSRSLVSNGDSHVPRRGLITSEAQR